VNAAPAPARTILLGLLALAAPSFGCDSSTKTDTKASDAKKADAKTGDAKKLADSKSGDAKKADAKKADATKAGDTKAGETKPSETKPETKPGETTLEQADAATAAEPRKYRRGMVPPEAMTPDELKRFATETGDPTNGEFTLAQAFEGDPALADPANGKLIASFDTTMGAFECELYEDQTPLTVANFVGLARGLRPTYDKKTDTWVTKKYFDGNIFHRVIKGFMIQTGDDTNSGRGNPGYVIVDELAKGLKHDSAGVLSMANREKPNTGSTQFFITVRDTKHLDGKHTVFGKCADAKVPIEISKVKVDPRAGDRPYEQVKINTITISRKKK
jgi:peptidyl-prolyl cis-trans isomerase A (cyclophilin A)